MVLMTSISRKITKVACLVVYSTEDTMLEKEEVRKWESGSNVQVMRVYFVPNIETSLCDQHPEKADNCADVTVCPNPFRESLPLTLSHSLNYHKNYIPRPLDYHH